MPGDRTDVPTIDTRKVVTVLEEIWHEGGPRAASPHRRGAIAAVIRNPYAGRYVQDILPMMDALKPLGVELARRLIEVLGGPNRIEAYGKGAIVGAAGELEHGALWHVPGGYAMRELLDKSLAIVPSAKKVGPTGVRIDIPIHHRQAAYVRSHFDAMEVGVPDAPRPDEIVYILAMTTGARVHARVGGLSASEISTWDGQR
ncbi:MAG: amino acid synthesis family protein [Burkholderiales bacterium]